MKYTKTGEYTYEDEDGITYDLSALDDLCDGMGGYLHFTARRGDEEAEIITNRTGGGMWTEIWTPFGPDYKQVAGTLQYRIPDTDKALCAQLRKRLLGAAELR